MSETKLEPIYTGFSRHVDICVSGDGVQPSMDARREARRLMGRMAIVKWINTAGHGYDTDWMWVMGIPL